MVAEDDVFLLDLTQLSEEEIQQIFGDYFYSNVDIYMTGSVPTLDKKVKTNLN